MVNNLITLLPLLRPLGAIYGFLMRCRAFLYEKSYLKSQSFTVPVISIGNLTMGGSGKTPTVIYLARFLQQQGYRPAVISRGYGGKASAKFNVVSDGKTLFLESYEAGDEPRLIAENVSGVAVITGKKRKDPCTYAVNQLGCNIIILDDAFQHLAVKRDIDLVLFNSATKNNLLHVLPAGILREPFSALKRANCFIITGSDDNTIQDNELVSSLRRKWRDKPLFHLFYRPTHCLDINGKKHELDSIPSPVFVFCGIASPHRFMDTLKTLSLKVADAVFFADHQHYDEGKINKLSEEAKKRGAKALLTTEKDLIKLKTFNIELPIYSLCMEIPPSSSLENYILLALASNNPLSVN